MALPWGNLVGQVTPAPSATRPLEGFAVTMYHLWNRPAMTGQKKIAQTNPRDMYTWILGHRAFYTLAPRPPISVKTKYS